MTRLLAVLGTLLLGACTAGLGYVRSIDAPTVALRAIGSADAATVADAIGQADPRAAFLMAPHDDAWFAAVAAAADRHLSGPADLDGLRVGFLAGEPLGDTTVTLRYDGGSLTVHDALYEVSSERYLDLMAFRIADAGEVRAAIAALLGYVATDVGNEAALVMAVAVPSAAAGDSVARMLAPAYYDARACGGGGAATTDREELRVFYGPDARMFCEDAEARETVFGDWLRAELIMGRRR